MKTVRFVALALLLASTAYSQITFSKAGYGTKASSVTTGDFDRDGRPDIASLFAGSDGVVTIFHSNSSGSFSQAFQFTVPTNQNNAWIHTADVNGDGKLDLIINKEYTPEIEIWYGSTGSSFVFGQILNLNFPYAEDVGLADLNRDGKVDFVAGYRDDTGSYGYVYLNDGSGNFTQKSIVDFGGIYNAGDFAVADFDRNGIPDIAVEVGSELREYTGNGDGTFALHRTTAAAQGSNLTVGDFTGDSTPDLALSTASSITAWSNDGSGKFYLRSTTSIPTSLGNLTSMAAGDLNNDDKSDLVLIFNQNSSTTATGTAKYLLNTGDGHFGSLQSVTSFSNAFTWQPVLRHLTRDSQMDIVVPSARTYVLYGSKAPANCTPPSSASIHVNICVPGSGSSTAKTFTVKAAGDSPAGVGRMELWLDGKKVFQTLGDQLKRTVTTTAGTHRLTVQAYDLYTGMSKKTIYVTAY